MKCLKRNIYLPKIPKFTVLQHIEVLKNEYLSVMEPLLAHIGHIYLSKSEDIFAKVKSFSTSKLSQKKYNTKNRSCFCFNIH